MQTVVLIGGFGGAGKTTVGSMLFDRLHDAAFVEADALFVVKPWSIGDRLGRIKLTNSLAVMTTFLNEGFSYIICTGLVWSQDELEAVTAAVASNRRRVVMVWLETSRSVRWLRVLARARDAADNEEFLDRVERTIADPWPLRSDHAVVVKIATDFQTPEEVTDAVLSFLSAEGRSESPPRNPG